MEISRNYRHPITLAGYSMTYRVINDKHVVVQYPPAGEDIGPIVARYDFIELARKCWKSAQDRLFAEGYQIYVKGAGDFFECDIEECPKHADAKLVREYTFGMQDATVSTYSCGCAVVTTELSGMNHGGYWYPSYNEAAGCAKLQVAMNAAK